MTRRRLAALLAASAATISACAAPQDTADRTDGVVDVVATTPILADLARQVAGDQARVTGLVPPGADPHSFEPGLHDIRNVANADVVLANHLLLEDQALMDTITHSRPDAAPLVFVAEASETYGAALRPLVEDVTLDTPWLGAQVVGDSTAGQAVDITLIDARGPGAVSAFLTGTFGQPQVHFNSANGIDDRDRLRLPVGAHTHLSWAFSEPGRYELDFVARSVDKPHSDLAAGTVAFAVGVDPGEGAVTGGHWDLAFDARTRELGVRGDDGAFTTAAVEVPSRALHQVPADPAHRFLGRPNDEVYLLPQAVLGKHVHGEIDPHTWHDFDNTRAAVQVIRDELAAADPPARATYEANAARYLDRLDGVEREVRAELDRIPSHRRHLVTTHDGYGYLARAFDLNVAGFVTPNPSVEPSARELVALTRTLQGLEVPAVFLEPAELERPGTLSEIATDLDVALCPILGDTLTDEAPTYLDLMTFNAHSLRSCLA